MYYSLYRMLLKFLEPKKVNVQTDAVDGGRNVRPDGYTLNLTAGRIPWIDGSMPDTDMHHMPTPTMIHPHMASLLSLLSLHIHNNTRSNIPLELDPPSNSAHASTEHNRKKEKVVIWTYVTLS